MKKAEKDVRAKEIAEGRYHSGCKDIFREIADFIREEGREVASTKFRDFIRSMDRALHPD